MLSLLSICAAIFGLWVVRIVAGFKRIDALAYVYPNAYDAPPRFADAERRRDGRRRFALDRRGHGGRGRVGLRAEGPVTSLRALPPEQSGEAVRLRAVTKRFGAKMAVDG